MTVFDREEEICVKNNLSKFRSELKQPYFCALLLIALVPIFPEYISFLLVIIATVFAAKDLRLSKRKLRVGIIGKLLIAFCCYQTLTCIYSANFTSTLAVSLMWWLLLPTYLIVSNLLIDQHRTERFLLLITAAAGVVGLITCIQYRINVFLEKENAGSIWLWLDKIVFGALSAFNIETVEGLEYHYRTFSTFANPNMLAQYLVMAAPFVACYNFMSTRKGSSFWFARICLLLTFAGVMFSFSRGGYIAILILAAGLFLLNLRHHFGKSILCLMGTLLCIPDEVYYRLFSVKKGVLVNTSGTNGLSAVLNAGGSTPPRAPSSAGGAAVVHKAETAMGERWEIWTESIKQFFDRPLLGHGAGTQTTLEMYKAIGIEAPHAHNIVLQILLEGGIVALLIMSAISIIALRNSVHTLRCHDRSSFWMGFAILGFLVCFMAHGMVDYPLAVPRLICFFIMILGIIEQSVCVYAHHINPKSTLFKKRRFRKA